MLEIKKINKIYKISNMNQHILKDISITFRRNEFVSILGPSGSGKTTFLNIIGGLDDYTSGDLIINGISTKKYRDNDWDKYRNHSVGFIFQNYNLIPHQTILANVELALTLSGVDKVERRKRAKNILKQVGLESQINKKPNQLSGGQMQRVAIARALINDPDILLADEPTGALDTKTSIQIMELLKKVAKDKLVIMVTHNPELANTYSTRIVKLTDGRIIDDSNPFNESDEKKVRNRNSKKNYMSFATALTLSLNNLMTKKGRTFLTSLAGSIGIIGIALILSLSNGVQSYIKKVQEDTLSSYPLTIEKTSIDSTSLLQSFMNNNKNNNETNYNNVYSNNIMTDMLSIMSSTTTTNNLKRFKSFLNKKQKKLSTLTTDIQYSYAFDLNLYKINQENEIVKVNPSTVFDNLGLSPSSNSVVNMNSNIWTQLGNNKDLLKTQYSVIAGKWPSNYNEVVLIIDKNNEISDYALYSLGVKNQDELKQMVKKITNSEKFDSETTKYSFDDLLNLSFKLVLNTDYYKKENGIWVDKSSDEEFMINLLNNSEEIKIVGIIKPNEESKITTTGGIGYLNELTEYVIQKVNETEIAKEQLNNPDINVFTGLQFSSNKDSFDINLLTNEQKMYLSSLSEEQLANFITDYTNNLNASYEQNISKLGIVSIDDPSEIRIYPIDFESKDTLTNLIKEYNNNQEEQNKIKYTDTVGIMMSSVTSIINIISYVLIAFVAISLVVSSIMIGIITYISVLERTKEIGILRAIGASKKDISRVFNAETVIEGFTSGVIGIIVTILLNIPINIIIKEIVGVSNISKLPVLGAVILIIISIILTFIAGLIPSRFASKKDPVEALRTE